MEMSDSRSEERDQLAQLLADGLVAMKEWQADHGTFTADERKAAKAQVARILAGHEPQS